MLHVGIDIGSTTLKLVVLGEHQEIIFSSYRRHHAEIQGTLMTVLSETMEIIGDCDIRISITGSAGLGIAERFGIPFIQETISSAEVVRRSHPDVHTLIDVGGEDVKMIFFDDIRGPDIRMNGSCAGGTGAFLDQMATLLDVSVTDLDTLASKHQHRYPIASRCGVFAKTDVQYLISRQIPREDIAATIFYAVALQTKNALTRGNSIKPGVLFCGGPLTYLPSLRAAFCDVLQVSHEQICLPGGSEVFAAVGAALTHDDSPSLQTTFRDLRLKITPCGFRSEHISTQAEPLFHDEQEFEDWSRTRSQTSIEKVDLARLNAKSTFLGIDSGSTTTKIVLIDAVGRIAFDYYANNKGNPINAVRDGMDRLLHNAQEGHLSINVTRSIVTGYGEDLIRAAFGFDGSMVETLAHYRAARAFRPDVSFILDIGGQDMKAMFIDRGIVKNIEINEACSSGCGSFIETFAESLGSRISDFAQSACRSTHPCDLGSRCTVFMNSRVKQSLREGSSVANIAGGLAYSVVKNCLQKVLKIHDTSILGDVIVVQGGTFRNPAVHRALEKTLGKNVLCPARPELMGAYGAALTARDEHLQNSENVQRSSLSGFVNTGASKKKTSACHGCENACTITTLMFENGQRFFTGNKCEKIFNNRGISHERGRNIADLQYHLLFDRRQIPDGKPRSTIGIPRVLNIYENFPFWCTLLVECGMKVVLSPASTNAVCDSGSGTIMSDNICFPAKLAHGHIQQLVADGVDRILYPMVFGEDKRDASPSGCWNCPVVAAYPDVIRSAMNPDGKHHIPLDTPTISFENPDLLKEACFNYLCGLGVQKDVFTRAFQLALVAQETVHRGLQTEARTIIENSRKENKLLIVLAGRPYHLDPLINHKIPEIIADMGADVVTMESLPAMDGDVPEDVQVLAQWSYPNRLYKAARWVGSHPSAEFIQLNSFGCGPDSITIEEVRGIVTHYGKNHTLIRIDEVISPGSMRLRLRSLIDSLKMRSAELQPERKERPIVSPFKKEDKRRTVLVPFFSQFYSPLVAGIFENMGYIVKILPPTDKESREIGLKYTNNEICYPAILVIGDIIKALQSGRYSPADVAVGITQTGGQCRASNYVPLIKKALLSAGFKQTPIVSVSTSHQDQNEQPGFEVDTRRLLKNGFWGIMFGDALSHMYYSTVSRERRKGESRELVNKFSGEGGKLLMAGNSDNIIPLLASAIAAFNGVPVDDDPIPRVGIVGEIYVKYNGFSNNFIIDWICEQGVEVEIPPLIDFFAQLFVNVEASTRLHLQEKKLSSFLAFLAERFVQTKIDRIDRIMQGYRRYRPQSSIRHLASLGSRIVSLADQFGEGWLIPAEIGYLAEQNIRSIICLQPFGCIANHIVAKGVEKRMRELFPRINLLFLDMDAGAGDANLHNRLYFILHGAKDDRRAKAASERIQIHPEIRPHPHDFFSHELRSGENASLYRFI